jgi:hypothetical protein
MQSKEVLVQEDKNATEHTIAIRATIVRAENLFILTPIEYVW